MRTSFVVVSFVSVDTELRPLIADGSAPAPAEADSRAAQPAISSGVEVRCRGTVDADRYVRVRTQEGGGPASVSRIDARDLPQCRMPAGFKCRTVVKPLAAGVIDVDCKQGLPCRNYESLQRE
jgi:hypothetical protein